MDCPNCGGEMWDNREKKKTPNAPDYKCKDKTCLDENGFVTAVWLPKEDKPKPQSTHLPKPSGTKASTLATNGDEFVMGKKENTRVMKRTDLMVALINKWHDVTALNDLKEVFNDLWAEIEK